jgi:hypothetical protein
MRRPNLSQEKRVIALPHAENRGFSDVCARAILLCLIAIIGLAIFPAQARATDSAEQGMRRLAIGLSMKDLPEKDAAASTERTEAIRAALDSPLPLFRSFDARETLAESLRQLESLGVDTGSTAIVNFDGLEANVPVEAIPSIKALPFVRGLTAPVAPTPTGFYDSEGIEIHLADLAHIAGARGDQVKVAIIDMDFGYLNAVTALPDDELPLISSLRQFREDRSFAEDAVSVNGYGTREHGTAATEVVYEMAPGVEFYLFATGSLGGTEQAIDRAVAVGAEIILVLLSSYETMGDPKGIAEGGTNRFTDNVDAAVAAGVSVIVPAGNAALTQVRQVFKPCTDCINFENGGICNEASNDTDYHQMSDDFFGLADSSVNDIIFNDDYYDAGSWSMTCYSAMEPGYEEYGCDGPSNSESCKFRLRIWEFDLFSDFFEPTCPNDAGAAMVRKANEGIGRSFDVNVRAEDGSTEYVYYISVFYSGDVSQEPPQGWPEFRVICTTGVDENLYYNEGKSLSDLAVIHSAISVTETPYYYEDETSPSSSRGPTIDTAGPTKPDLSGVGGEIGDGVTNASVEEAGFAFFGFWGTSAAAAHVTGAAALIQGHRRAHGLPPFSPAVLKQWLQRSVTDIVMEEGDEGLDEKSGAGLHKIPGWVLLDAPGGLVLDEPAEPLVIGAANEMTGLGFTPGTVVKLFVSAPQGLLDLGPYPTTNVTPSSFDFEIPADVELGNGLASVYVVNTDENYLASNSVSSNLIGNPVNNQPTILEINGIPVAPANPSIPTNNIETVLPQGSTITISGEGFNNPGVALFTANGNVGPLWPSSWTSTEFQVVVPPGAPTGPGSIQVVNSPFEGNVRSNAVSVPIGALVSLDSVTQEGSLIRLRGTGFSTLTAMNFFNDQGGGNVVNLGGLNGGGTSAIPINFLSPEEITFTVPAGAVNGAAYIMAINPPWIPYNSSGNSPNGAFTLTGLAP